MRRPVRGVPVTLAIGALTSPAWGASFAALLLAGVVTGAAALAGHPLGLLGPALYQLDGPAGGITNVATGTTAIGAVPGWLARPGYDLATGTVTSAARLAAALAQNSNEPARESTRPGRNPHDR